MEEKRFKDLEIEIINENAKNIFNDIYINYFNKRLSKVERNFFELVSDSIPSKFKAYEIRIINKIVSSIPLGVNIVCDDSNYILVDNTLNNELKKSTEKKSFQELIKKTKSLLDKLYIELSKELEDEKDIEIFDFLDRHIPKNISSKENEFIRSTIGNRIILDNKGKVIDFIQ